METGFPEVYWKYKEVSTVEREEYTQQNRKAWNEASQLHARARGKKKERDAFPLDPLVTGLMEKYQLLQGKTIAHLCCNNGRETMALKRMGASCCVGFDISDEAIAEAQASDVKPALKCRFVRTDVYDIPKEYEDTFHLIYISAGALIWLPDLDRFFQIVQGLLKSQGEIFIYEIHPYLWMLEGAPETHPLQLTNSYFKQGPVISYGGLDYIGHNNEGEEKNYSFDHTLSHILNSLIKNRFTLKGFYEYSHDISACFSHLDDEKIQIPMSFILYGAKSEWMVG